MNSQELDNLTTENQQLKQQLTELKQQLMTAQKMSSVGELASSITHEFNNILTTVINYAKLGMRHRTDEMRDKAFDKILAAGQRASKITTGMLSYARSRGDRREPMQIKQLVDDILVLVEKDLHVHRIECRVDVQGDPYAEVNASQVQQVLLNLIINARQAMEPGGVLTVGIVEESPFRIPVTASLQRRCRTSSRNSTQRSLWTGRGREEPDWGSPCAKMSSSRTVVEFELRRRLATAPVSRLNFHSWRNLPFAGTATRKYRPSVPAD